MKLKHLFKIVLFSLIFCICFNISTYVLRDKTNAELIDHFWEEPKNTIDVLFLGASSCYRSIYPLDLWKEYGITSYNLGSSEQPLTMSYWLTKEAMNKQNPRVVVLECRMSLFMDNKYYSYPRVHQVIDNMPFSMNKLAAINDVIPKEDRLGFYFKIGTYHTRWSSLTSNDFQPIPPSDKGIGYSATITQYGNFDIIEKEEKIKLSDLVEEYIIKMKKLCDENNAQLVLLTVPYYYGVEHPDCQKKLNSIYEIAQKLNITYINGFSEFDAIGFDTKTDFAENLHLNINGAKKLSSYLGKYLTTHFKLKNRKNMEELAEKWDLAYQNSLITQENAWLQSETNIEKYIEQINKDNYKVVIINNKQKADMLDNIFKQMKIEKITDINFAVIKNRTLEKVSKGYTLTEKLDNNTCIYADITEGMSIKINDKEKAKISDGTELLVYDKRVNQIIDIIYLYESNNEIIVKR